MEQQVDGSIEVQPPDADPVDRFEHRRVEHRRVEHLVRAAGGRLQVISAGSPTS
ncbi:hypothetical protein ACN27F_27665 [Solwaraspora sp. WMMB335]|uniref:hypothetical protein n=1 Tax=Solwaraspora sp. WMMB335 TaxID=3404118 RepID=UPI003B92E7A2